MQEKNEIIEQLRKDLISYIKIQEEVAALYKKILKRITIITVPVALLLLMGIGFTIYTITKPLPPNEFTIKNVQDWNNSILIQRKFIEMDRQDIARAREQFMEGLRRQDSIERERDSVLDFKYRQAIK